MIDLTTTYGLCRNHGHAVVDVVVRMQLRAKRTSLQLRKPSVTKFADCRQFPVTHPQTSWSASLGSSPSVYLPLQIASPASLAAQQTVRRMAHHPPRHLLRPRPDAAPAPASTSCRDHR